MTIRRPLISVLPIATIFAAVGACANHAPPPAPLPAAPPVLPPSPPADVLLRNFDETVQAFQATALLLENIPPSHESRVLRRSVEQLADAIEATPTKVEMLQPAMEAAAAAMRNEWVRWGSVINVPAGTAPDQRTGSMKQALATAAGAIRTLSEQDPLYAADAVKSALTELDAAVQRIDAGQPLSTARPAVLTALQAASRAMGSVKQAALVGAR